MTEKNFKVGDLVRVDNIHANGFDGLQGCIGLVIERDRFRQTEISYFDFQPETGLWVMIEGTTRWFNMRLAQEALQVLEEKPDG